MNPLFAGLPTTVFAEMSALAAKHDAINLGQGFPDSEGPEDVRKAAAEAAHHGYNQYPPTFGLPVLREAIAAHYAHHQRLDIDPMSEVLVTSGATEALAASIMAIVEPGDEVILFAPAYDAYAPLVRQAGGTPVFVRLEPPDWAIGRDMIEAAVTDATKAILLNDPVNPAARMCSGEERSLLAEICIAHDLIAICDEVWEHIVFDDARHGSLIALPGMRDRTVKIGSAGKIFSLTGWKVGWVIAAPPLTAVIAKAHQFLTFTTPPNLQTAIAYGLGKDDDYFRSMRADFQASRDRLSGALSDAGYAVLPSAATYFLCIDLAASGIAIGDRDYCLKIVEEFGVAAIPVSAFYEADPVNSIVRLCFAKADETLDAAGARLAEARKAMDGGS